MESMLETMNRAMQRLVDLATLSDELPTPEHAERLRGRGVDVPLDTTLDGWADRLGLDYDEEVGEIIADPNGDRARELAAVVRDHQDGGVTTVMALVRAVCAMLPNSAPLPAEQLRAAIEALPKAYVPCAWCGSFSGFESDDDVVDWPRCYSCGGC